MVNYSPLVVMLLSALAALWVMGFAEVQGATLTIAVTGNNEEFSPQRLVIRAGEKVTWINQDGRLHSLVSGGLASRQFTARQDGLFINTPLPNGSRFSQRFLQPGTYYYFCANHVQMWGVVVAEQ